MPTPSRYEAFRALQVTHPDDPDVARYDALLRYGAWHSQLIDLYDGVDAFFPAEYQLLKRRVAETLERAIAATFGAEHASHV